MATRKLECLKFELGRLSLITIVAMVTTIFPMTKRADLYLHVAVHKPHNIDKLGMAWGQY